MKLNQERTNNNKINKMARVLANGLISGRIGDVIHYVHNGKQCIRKAGKSLDPNTLKQKIHRAKYRGVSHFLKHFKEVVKIGYPAPQYIDSGYNEAFQHHYRNSLVDVTINPEEPLFEIDFSKVRLARGLKDCPRIISCQRQDNELSLTWENSLSSPQNRYNDTLALVAYVAGKKVFTVFHAGNRKTGSTTITLPAQFNEPVSVWAFFWKDHKYGTPSRANVSDSVWVGTF